MALSRDERTELRRLNLRYPNLTADEMRRRAELDRKRVSGEPTTKDKAPPPMRTRRTESPALAAERRAGRVGQANAPRKQAATQKPAAPAAPSSRPGSGVTPTAPMAVVDTVERSAAPAPVAPADWQQVLREQYPAMAGFLDIPEVGAVLQQSVAEGWPPEKLAARVQATTWWRSTPVKARTWLGLSALDPATAERQVVEQAGELRGLLDDFIVNVSDQALSDWSRKLLSGLVPETAFVDYLKEQSKSLYPALASAIDQGITPKTYVEPYRQVAAQLLEMAPEAIDFRQQRWQRPLNVVDKDGNRTAMSLADWQTEIMRDPTYGWDRTRNAREQAAQFQQRFAQMMGVGA